MTQQEFFSRYTYKPSTDKLGEDGFGTVYKAYDTILGNYVAIRIIKLRYDGVFHLENDYKLSKALQTNSYTAEYLDYFLINFEGTINEVLIMKFYVDGELSTICKNHYLPTNTIRSLLIKILECLIFLHDSGVEYGTLSPKNILIEFNKGKLSPKLKDFSLSQKFEPNKRDYKNKINSGILNYSSPERFKIDSLIYENSDLWSFGVLAYWLFTEKLPYNVDINDSFCFDEQKISQQIQNNLQNILIPLDFRLLIEKCLIFNQQNRILNAKKCLDFLLEFESLHPNQDDTEEKRIETISFKKPIIFTNIDYADYEVYFKKYHANDIKNRLSDLSNGFYLKGVVEEEDLAWYPTGVRILGSEIDIPILIHKIKVNSNSGNLVEENSYSFIYKNSRVYFLGGGRRDDELKYEKKHRFKAINLMKSKVTYNSVDVNSSDILNDELNNVLDQIFSFKNLKELIFIGSVNNLKFMNVIDYFAIELYTKNNKTYFNEIEIVIKYI